MGTGTIGTRMSHTVAVRGNKQHWQKVAGSPKDSDNTDGLPGERYSTLTSKMTQGLRLCRRPYRSQTRRRTMRTSTGTQSNRAAVLAAVGLRRTGTAVIPPHPSSSSPGCSYIGRSESCHSKFDIRLATSLQPVCKPM